jgi:site-specific DNA recombinase
MWAQTYHSGQQYYREHKNSRSLSKCPSAGGSIGCHIPDEQVGKLIEAIELGPEWFEEVLAMFSLKDEAERIKKSRQVFQEKLRRLARTYNDLLITN